MATGAAQDRFHEFKDNDTTLWMNWKNSSYHPKGRYAGFDYDNTSANLTLKLNHASSGWAKVELDTAIVNNKGVWTTNQGVNIVEHEGITLTVEANATGNYRIDLIIGTHAYNQLIGGQLGTYSVIKGVAAATPVEPSLPNPNQDVIIGRLYVSPNGAAVTDMQYIPASVPTLSAGVRTDKENTFTDKQTIKSLQGAMLVASIDENTNNTIVLAPINPEAIPTEQKIGNFYELVITNDAGGDDIVFVDNILPEINVADGFRVWIKTPTRLWFITNGLSGIMSPRNNAEFIVHEGEFFEVVRINGKWLVSDSGARTSFYPNKFRGIQAWNGIPVSLVDNKLGGFNLDGSLFELGNLWEINNSGSETINYIHSPKHVRFGEERGTMINVFIKNEGTITFAHDAANVPVNYKPIKIGAGKDYIISGDGLIIQLVETETHWLVVNQGESGSLSEDWINVTGDLDGSKFASALVGVPQISYRKEGNLLRLRGVLKIFHAGQATGNPIGEVFTLPLSHRPKQNWYRKIRIYPNAANLDSSSLTGDRVVLITISTLGSVFLSGGQGDLTEDMRLSLDGLMIDLK